MVNKNRATNPKKGIRRACKIWYGNKSAKARSSPHKRISTRITNITMNTEITPIKVGLLSIHEKYATAIYEGYKTYEVRKTSIKARKIYLYETKPIALVRGFILIDTPIEIKVSDIIENYLSQTCLTDQQVREYARNRSTLYLWPIKEVHRIDPFKLYLPTPQSFIYIYE